MNEVYKEAIEFCNTIQDTSYVYEKHLILNIFQGSTKVYHPSLSGYPDELIIAYGFINEDILTLLRQEGIIEAYGYRDWYISTIPESESSTDSLTSIAKKKGYFKEECIIYASQLLGYANMPDLPKMGCILINTDKLVGFIRLHANTSPYYNPKENSLEFVGEKAPFNLIDQISAINLFVQNINCIVSRKVFYESKEESKQYTYESKIARYTESVFHDTLDKSFYRLRDHVYKNKELKKALSFVQNDGYGLFVNQNYLYKVPHQ